MKLYKASWVSLCFLTMLISYAGAQNPLIRNQYTADPTARVFEGKLYIYPSHDILATPGHGRLGWFCMEDYHVFSSANLTDWTDHGGILSQTTVPWADPAAYSMWAPDCVFRNGKYYFYFPTNSTGGVNGKGFTIGVATSDKPYGPFTPQAEPIKGVHGIDPNVFIDKNGQAYLYWSQGNIYAAKLKDNMIELDSAQITLANLPDKGLKEGPFMFERKGIYYLTYPHVANKIERLEYATSNNPLGPFKFTGVIMDESASGCWTNHQSIVEFKNQWYLFYHDNQFSPKFDKARSIKADSLFFNEDGTIRKVMPTLRGIGVANAQSKIETDRYSAISNTGASVDFIDTANRFNGWKVNFNQQRSWVRYNAVAFDKNPKSVEIMAKSARGSKLEIRLDKIDGPLVGARQIAKGTKWAAANARIQKTISGKHDIFIILTGTEPAEIDWIRFKN
nr:family 43 glycosylhydrolase [uncultured Mucilaginibacter sp.]